MIFSFNANKHAGVHNQIPWICTIIGYHVGIVMIFTPRSIKQVKKGELNHVGVAFC